MGSPEGPTRAPRRDAWISISATRPWTSGSIGASSARIRPSNPIVTGRRRVAFVEDEVDDLEHRRQTGGELGPTRDLERDARLGEGPFGPDDPLGDGRLRHEECTR